MQYVSLKYQLTFKGQHGAASQKKELFITTTVRTSNAQNLALYQMQFHKDRSVS
jgi:hypothetical protein